MRTDYIYAFSPATAIQDGIIYDFFFFFISFSGRCYCYLRIHFWYHAPPMRLLSRPIQLGMKEIWMHSPSGGVWVVWCKFDLCIEWKKKKKLILGEIKSYFGHNLDYSIWYDSPSFSILWYIFNSFKTAFLNGFINI